MENCNQTILKQEYLRKYALLLLCELRLADVGTGELTQNTGFHVGMVPVPRIKNQ